MKKLKTFDGTEFVLTDEQAEAIYTATTGRDMPKLIQVGNEMVATSAISSIEEHFERDAYQPVDNSHLIDIPKSKEPGMWEKCFRMNVEHMKTNKLPIYTVEKGEILKKEHYWRA